MGHQNDNVYVLIMLLGKLLCRVQGLFFGPKFARKYDFFTVHPYNPHFLGLDGSNLMGSYVLHILR